MDTPTYRLMIRAGRTRPWMTDLLAHAPPGDARVTRIFERYERHRDAMRAGHSTDEAAIFCDGRHLARCEPAFVKPRVRR